MHNWTRIGVRLPRSNSKSTNTQTTEKNLQKTARDEKKEKHCPTCEQTKPLSEFYNHKSYKDGKKRQCKDCENQSSRARYERLKDSGQVSIKNKRETNREGYLKRTFGISSQQYEELLEAQGGCCAICKRHHTEFNKRLAVDHAHTDSSDIPAGMIRGLLCFHCNHLVVGRHTNADIFENAANYLRTHTGWMVPEDKIKPKRKFRRRKKQ